MTEWKTYRLGELVAVKGGKRLPKGISLQTEPNSHPYIRIRDMGKSRVLELDTTYEYVDDVTQKSIARYIVNKGDVLLSIVGTIGLVGIVGDTLHLANQTENCVKLVDCDGIDPLFLYYFLLSPKGQDEIKRGTVGAVQAKLPIKNIENIEVSLPSLEEQRRIAGILGAIDDKIENNRRINDNLEQQAQALFDEWFVNDSTQPAEYNRASLTDIANYLNGLAMQRFRPQSDEKAIPVLKIKELGQGMCDSSSDICSQSIDSKYIVNDGDIIFSWSGTLLVDIWCGGICGLNQHLFKVTSDKYPKWYVYYWTKYHLAKFIRIAKDKAVTMGHIKRGDLETSEVLIPNAEILSKMDNIIAPIFDAIISRRVENKTLATLRDSLLPKLMNGEIKL